MPLILHGSEPGEISPGNIRPVDPLQDWAGELATCFIGGIDFGYTERNFIVLASRDPNIPFPEGKAVLVTVQLVDGRNYVGNNPRLERKLATTDSDPGDDLPPDAYIEKATGKVGDIGGDAEPA